MANGRFTTWRHGWAAAREKRSEPVDCEEDEEVLEVVRSRECWVGDGMVTPAEVNTGPDPGPLGASNQQ
jgi:hypothetical protein